MDLPKDLGRNANSNAADPIAEGRRIYLGNLLYTVKPQEIEQVLAANDLASYENIHISIDPISSRNPGYCFVDFADRATAERALSSLVATIRGRPLKVGPCEAKKQRVSRWQKEEASSNPTSTFPRWGNWAGPRTVETGVPQGSFSTAGTEQGPYAALDHFDDLASNESDGRRIFIGGLGKMVDQAHNEAEIRKLLAGFNPTAIGKRITPHKHTLDTPGNHHFCFVDFATPADGLRAIAALDGKQVEGGRLRVRIAKPMLNNLEPRGRIDGTDPGSSERSWRRGHDRPPRPRDSDPSSKTTGSQMAMQSANWWRKDT